MILKADLHIHSLLSPCGSLDMSPGAIVDEACKKGLQLIAITDHNTVKQSLLLPQIANKRLFVLFGMELQTESETHVVCLFDAQSDAEKFAELIYSKLPDIPNNPEVFGDQIVVDAQDMILYEEKRLLLQSVMIEIEEAIDLVHQHNGLIFASHIDRDTYSIISQLGFIREGLPLDAIEISRHMTLEEAQEQYRDYLNNYPVIRNSDAHYLEDIGKASTYFDIEEPTIAEIRKALFHMEGRGVYYDA